MKKYVWIFSLILLAANPACKPEKQVFSPELKANIEARVEKEIITGIVIGMVTPEGTNYYSCGVKSMETKEPVDEHTVFEIGSNTKTFTGLLLADEVTRGELKLDDPIQKLLPEEITAPTRKGEQIKFVNLANHTSSLPRTPDNFVRENPLNPYASLSLEQVYEFLNGYVLPYDIGTNWNYSNLGIGLLGDLLADKNNTDYEGLVLDRISKPLGMKDTRIVLTPDMEKRLAKGHSLGEQVENWDFPSIAGCGALRSTAVDMIKYLKANMGMDKSELYPAMQLSHKVTHSGNSFAKTGLGWLISDIEGEEIIWHDGGTGGYMSFMGFNSSRTKGVVVLTNSTGFPDDIGFHLLNPDYELADPLPTIATKLNKVIRNEGIDAAIKMNAALKKDHADEYDFGGHGLIRLGYRFMHYGQMEEALAVLKINVENNPDDWNANDSYAEALLKNKQKEMAINHYKKSIELNPENESGKAKLRKMGVSMDD